jgi:hypothetical protein
VDDDGDVEVDDVTIVDDDVAQLMMMLWSRLVVVRRSMVRKQSMEAVMDAP